MNNLNQQDQQFAFDGVCQVHAHSGVHGATPIRLSNVAVKHKNSELSHLFPLDVATEIAIKWVKKQSKCRSGTFCAVRTGDTAALIRLVLGNGRTITCPPAN